MKRLVVIIYLIIQFPSMRAQSEAVKAVAENMKKQEVAWNNFDIDGFMKYYWNNDSLKFIGSKGITYGWKNTLENYKKGYPDKKAMGFLTFTNITIEELSANSIYVIGK